MPPEAPAELPHVTRRNPLTGAVMVHYACPRCAGDLKSPVSDAGLSDDCPDCGATFRVPGAEARRAEDQRQAAEAAEREAAAERKRERAATLVRGAADLLNRPVVQMPPATSRQNGPATGWCGPASVLLIIVGAITLIVGLAQDTSVSTAGTGFRAERVHNIGLLNAQLILVLTGAGTLLAGILLAGVSALGAEVHRWGRALAGDENGQTDG